MASKVIDVPGVGPVHLYKRRGSRHIRLTITHDGKVRVTMPFWTPYQTGVSFVNAKKQWLEANQALQKPVLADHARIGKAHTLVYCSDTNTTRPVSKIFMNEIRIKYPATLNIDDVSVQDAARKACIRALRKQAEALLPGRLAQLAQKHGYTYGSVTVKQLKSRWGSCDSKGNITLNVFLMQLPWHLIDYVLIHELVHTKVMNHGTDFWQEFENSLPSAKLLRRHIKEYKAAINPV